MKPRGGSARRSICLCGDTRVNEHRRIWEVLIDLQAAESHRWWLLCCFQLTCVWRFSLKAAFTDLQSDLGQQTLAERCETETRNSDIKIKENNAVKTGPGPPVVSLTHLLAMENTEFSSILSPFSKKKKKRVIYLIILWHQQHRANQLGWILQREPWQRLLVIAVNQHPVAIGYSKASRWQRTWERSAC